jgi:hypothetical protein
MPRDGDLRRQSGTAPRYSAGLMRTAQRVDRDELEYRRSARTRHSQLRIDRNKADIRFTECTIVRGFIHRRLFRRFNLRTAPEGLRVDTRNRGIAIFLALTCGIGLAGCGALPPLDSTANEVRTIRPTADTSKTVSVPEGMVWYSTASRSSGLRFPPGTYALEAEDDDYLYFRAPSPLEFRSFLNGRPSHYGTTGSRFAASRITL